MKLARKLALGVALAVVALASGANAADMKIALVVKSLGNGFFEAPIRAPRKPPRNSAASRSSIPVRPPRRQKARSR